MLLFLLLFFWFVLFFSKTVNQRRKDIDDRYICKEVWLYVELLVMMRK